MNASQWRGRRVLITGHTGFKGAWLSLWLTEIGSEVTGFSLPPPTTPNLFELGRVEERLNHISGDVRDLRAVRDAVASARPDIVFHLAAQALVRRSYADPVETYQTNVLGTVNVLEACRASDSVRAVVVVTSDKCYANNGSGRPYHEEDPLGGRDPYSSSKGCAELACAAYRQSFFSSIGAPIVATARAGNVIGGGDFAADRLLPDLVRAVQKRERLTIRNPNAVRPWQHVVEALWGYLLLAERLLAQDRSFGEAWNFGPQLADSKPVEWILERAMRIYGLLPEWDVRPDAALAEAQLLMLDTAKAQRRLGWHPRLNIEKALDWTVSWYVMWDRGGDPQALTLQQIREYTN